MHNSSRRAFSAEAGPEALSANLQWLSSEIDALSISLKQSTRRQDMDATVRSRLHEIDVWGALQANHADNQGVSAVVGALNRLDQTTKEHDDPWAIRVLMAAADKPLVESLGRLVKSGDSAVLQALDRAIGQEPLSRSREGQLLCFVGQVVYPRYGLMTEWNKRGTAALPPFLTRITKRPYFVQACLDFELARITAINSPAVQLAAARQAEQRILDVLGLDQRQSQEFRLAIEGRTVRLNKDGEPISIEKGGGLIAEHWRTAMEGFIANYQALGAKKVRLLRQDWGIVNLDRYRPSQLERMARLSTLAPKDRSARKFVEFLQKSDVKILLTDRYGDRVNAAAADIATQETDDDTLLFAEVGNPAGLYLPLVRLKRRFGIVACHATLSAHGVTGAIYFGLKGKYNGQLGMAFEVGKTEPDLSDRRLKLKSPIDISNTQVGQFFHKYLRPSRKTGKRLVTLLVCSQGRAPKYSVYSTAEAMAWQTDPADQVEIEAYDNPLSVDEKTGELWDPVNKTPAIMRVYRHLTAASVDVRVR